MLAGRQNRLSSLDLADRRTGADVRARTFRTSSAVALACAELTTPGPTGCGSAGGILIPTGETLAQVQNRLLPIGAIINGVSRSEQRHGSADTSLLAGYGLVGVRGVDQVREKSEVFVDFENIFDKSYRGISWGIDGAGRGVTFVTATSF